MTPFKILGVVYTAISLCANPLYANDALRSLVPQELQHFEVHETPKAIASDTFLDAAGEPITLKDIGGKVLVVNFWATWCGPCRVEMPYLEELQNKLGGDNFKVITIAAGRNPPAMIDLFFDREGLSLLTKHRDPKMQFATALGVTSLPTTVIIDATGNEVARLVGEANWASEEIITFLAAIP